MFFFNAVSSLFLVLSPFTMPAAYAETSQQLLLTITSEPEGNLQHQLFLELDENQMITNIVRRSKGDTQEFSVEDLLEGPVVLAKAAGRNAVLLSCESCEIGVGGRLSLKYLYSGVTDKYRKYYMDLTYDGEQWYLQTVDGEEFSRLTLKSRKILGQLIGVSGVRVDS